MQIIYCALFAVLLASAFSPPAHAQAQIAIPGVGQLTVPGPGQAPPPPGYGQAPPRDMVKRRPRDMVEVTITSAGSIASASGIGNMRSASAWSTPLTVKIASGWSIAFAKFMSNASSAGTTESTHSRHTTCLLQSKLRKCGARRSSTAFTTRVYPGRSRIAMSDANVSLGTRPCPHIVSELIIQTQLRRVLVSHRLLR
jgi:hypothetical protein